MSRYRYSCVGNRFCKYRGAFWVTVCKTVRPMLSDRCPVLSCPSVCNVGVSWPNCWMEKGAHTPIFGPCLLWPNGWVDRDATWYEGIPRPMPHCVRRRPTPQRGMHSSPHLFGPCLLWPRSPISATAEFLFGI